MRIMLTMQSEIGIAQLLNDTMQPASNTLLLPSGANSRTWADISHVRMSPYYEIHDLVHDDEVRHVTHHV